MVFNFYSTDASSDYSLRISALESTGSNTCNIKFGFIATVSTVTINTGFDPKCILYQVDPSINKSMGMMFNSDYSTKLFITAVRLSNSSYQRDDCGYVWFYKSSVKIQTLMAKIYYAILG